MQKRAQKGLPGNIYRHLNGITKLSNYYYLSNTLCCAYKFSSTLSLLLDFENTVKNNVLKKFQVNILCFFVLNYIFSKKYLDD